MRAEAVEVQPLYMYMDIYIYCDLAALASTLLEMRAEAVGLAEFDSIG